MIQFPFAREAACYSTLSSCFFATFRSSTKELGVMKMLARRHGLRAILGAVVLLWAAAVLHTKSNTSWSRKRPAVGTTYTPTHPYLAEYERRVSVLLGDGRRIAAKLLPDTGGYRRSKLYTRWSGALYLEGFLTSRK